MKLCTSTQIRKLDQQTIDAGTSGIVLMERAGQHLCDVAVKMLGDVAGRTIIVVAGGGNNGGDGFVVARLLARLQAKVQVLLLISPDLIAGDAMVNFDLLADIPVVEIRSEEEAVQALLSGDLIVDSLLGTGLARDVLGRFACIIDRINTSECSVLAVDIPSGLDADTGQVLGCAVRADCTVTFQLQKLGMVQYPGCEYVGEVVVADIGILPELMAGEAFVQLLTHSSLVKLMPHRPVTGHKGSFGHILLIAGSTGKTGAAILSGLGCLRSGAGLVSLCVPEQLHQIFEIHLIEAMTIPVAGLAGTCFHNHDFGQIMAAAKNKSCVVMGPGLGKEATTGQLVNQLVHELDVPIVLDADGLNLLSAQTLENLAGREIVLTPHPGEMARLTGRTIAEIQQDRVASAVHLAQESGLVVVLKGAATVIAGPGGEVAINSTGNAGMGTGGMGDVLSGVIGALIGQGLSCFDAACLGVYCHGRAGDLLVENGMLFGYLASELANALPDAWQEFL